MRRLRGGRRGSRVQHEPLWPCVHAALRVGGELVRVSTASPPQAQRLSYPPRSLCPIIVTMGLFRRFPVLPVLPGDIEW